MNREQRLNVVRTLAAKNLTPPQIMVKTGATYAQVIGMALRNGIRLAGHSDKKKVMYRPPACLPMARDCKPDAWDTLPTSRPTPMADVGTNQCRWPLGDADDRICCGAHIRRGSYCYEHAVLAHVPTVGRISPRDNRHIQTLDWSIPANSNVLDWVRIKPRSADNENAPHPMRNAA